MFSSCCGGRADRKLSSEAEDSSEEVVSENENNDTKDPDPVIVKEEVAKDEIVHPKEVVIDEPIVSPKSAMVKTTAERKKSVRLDQDVVVIDPGMIDSVATGNDDDEVFDDSIEPLTPRGDMCTPYPVKKGSTGTVVPLPQWFSVDEEDEAPAGEKGGATEPPATPVGKDELALRRHRFFSELMLAAQAAAEHRVCFDPLGPKVSCDSECELKTSSATAELENLVTRLERVTERLEKTISLSPITPANQTKPEDGDKNQELLTNGQQEKSPEKQEDSVKIAAEPIEIKVEPIENQAEPIVIQVEPVTTQEIQFQEVSVEKELVGEEKKVNGDVEEKKKLVNGISEENGKAEESPEKKQVEVEEKEYSINGEAPVSNMSVAGFGDIVQGPLAQYLALSKKIGGDVATHAQFVEKAFSAQLEFLNKAAVSSAPAQNDLQLLLQPTSHQISAIQDFREKHRASPVFNHLSAISESIPALGWVCVAPTPGPHVKEMNDAGQFYTNRVLKEWKGKDETHVEWTKAWVQTLTDLQKFVKQYHTTGLVWGGKKGGAPPAPCLPPPPPMMPVADVAPAFDDDGKDRSALFAEINQGEGITKTLKKVTSDMQTHKNPTLRTGPAPFKAPVSAGPVKAPVANVTAAKPPVFARDGKKWLVEYQKGNTNLVVENAEMNNVVYMYRCENSNLQVKGKLNSVVLDSCKKCAVVFDSLVSSIEFVNCQSVQMQVLGTVPTISIDKTDGCQMYLSPESLNVEIVSSKSSEMNVLLPDKDKDFIELPIPEQFKTTVSGKSLKTTPVESLG